MVEVPSASADRPSWTRVGVIAAVGFAVGVAWPRLAGIRLGPSVPESAATQAAPASGAAASATTSRSGAALAVLPAPALTGASASGAAGSPAPGPAMAGGSPPASAGPLGTGRLAVSASRGNVLSCQGADGGRLRGSECGTLPGLDALIQPRLHRLAECSAGAGASGKLHLVVRVDFDHGVGADLGRSRGTEAADAYLACARKALSGTPLSGVAHEQRRYSVAYVVTLTGDPSAPSAAATGGGPPLPSASSAQADLQASAPVADGDPATGRARGSEARAGSAGEGTLPGNAQADGSAKVEWDVAIVRDAPKTGKVIARLPRGTALRVGAARDGWYDIKYGDDLASDGWVYRAAIGR